MLQNQNLQASNVVVNKAFNDNEPEDAALSSYSQKDGKWDHHKSRSQDVKAIYSQSPEFENLAARMADCAHILKFAWVDDSETGESRIKLREAQFCRVRYCPTCQWRRSLMNQARFLQALPSVVEKYPTHRWLLLTLTVRNCNITELKSTLQSMNAAWNRLRLRSEFSLVTGWVRSTEVTRGADGSAHPHFHALLMVPTSMLGRNYVTQARWTELWKETAKLEYEPVVDIRAIKSKGDKSQNQNGGVVGAIETLKYAVKSTDMTADPDWFLELTRQTFKLRFLAAGGVLKDAIRKKDIETDQDMVHAGDSDDVAEDDGSRIAFNFRKQERKYRRFKKGDKSQNDGQ